MTSDKNFVEIQGTAEKTPFSKSDLDQMTELATKGCMEIFYKQQEIIGNFFPLKL
jgi:ribonuclease PH